MSGTEEDTDVAMDASAVQDAPADPVDPVGEADGDVLDSADPSLDLDDSALGQNEIDDLFDISMEDDEPTTGIDALLRSTSVPHRRLPLLEACFDRLTRTLSTSLRNLTREQVELSLSDSRSVRFGDYIEGIPLPALVSIFKADPWNGYGLITVDSPLIYSVVDMLLGGRRASAALEIEGRAFTGIETRLIERVIRLVLDEMSAAFEPLSAVAFCHERLESNPALASIAHPTAIAVMFKIDIDMEDRGGSVQVLLPYATLEPVRDLLDQAFMGDKFGRDTIWESHWTSEMHLADADLEVTLGSQTMPLGKILALKVGSTLKLNAKPGDLVTLTCGQVPLMRGKVGRAGEAMAIQVEHWIAPSHRQTFKA